MFEVEKALSSVRSGISFSLLEPGGESLRVEDVRGGEGVVQCPIRDQLLLTGS